MATFRVGVGSFNIQDGAVGFGTDTDGLGNLKVKGVTKTTDIKVSGASTLTRYSGFAADNINQLENITLTSEVGTIGDIVVGVGTSVIISSASTVTVGTVESVSIGTHFSPPKGGIEERGQDFVEGMLRFNTDLNTMEFYNGNEWRQFTYIADIQNSPSGRGRGVIGGGRSPNHTTSMEFIQFHTLGNGISFGDLQNNSTYKFPNSSAVRGIFAGGYEPGGTHDTNIINYITIASEGDAIDFGDLVTDSGIGSGASSSTRGVQFGGWINPGTNHNVIQYIEISTLGNSLDFGDTNTTLRGWGATNSTTRAIIAGGEGSVPANSLMEFVTIAALGNGVEFGDLTQARRLDNQNASGSTRGVFMGGGWADSTDTIDFVNHASLGNAVDFGNLINETGLPASSASLLRGIVCGGYDPAHVNIIEFVTIATAGNAQDFGDMSETRHGHTAISDCHGGLGGY